MRRLTTDGLLFLTTLVSVSFFQTLPSHNEWSHWAPALSYLERTTWAIDEWADRDTVDWSERDGHRYSNKAPGLSMLAVPVLAVLPTGPERLPRSLHVANVLLNGIPTALMAVAFFRVASRLVPDPRAAAAAAGIAVLATMSLPFATAFFAHQPVAALLFLSFTLLSFDRFPHAAGALAGLAVLCDYPAVLGTAALGLFAASRSRRALALYVAGGLPMAAPMLVYHHTCFGSPFALPHQFMNPAFAVHGRALGMFGGVTSEAFFHLTVSPYRGLFFTAPHLLAALAGMWLLWKRGDRAVPALGAGLLAVFLLLNASFNNWHGGGTYAPRYLLPAVPFLSLGLAPILQRRFACAWLAVPGLLVSLATVATGLAAWPNFRFPLAQWTLPKLLHGPVDTWNVFHLPQPWSLLPLGALWAWGAWRVSKQPVE